MRIWIDLANSPHVLFFAPLIEEMERRGHSMLVTARVLAQTTELIANHAIEARVIGAHGGHGTAHKAASILSRSRALRDVVRDQSIDLAVSHNSYAQAIAARMLGIPVVTLMDYERTPANHVSFRIASRVILPDVIRPEEVRKYGVTRSTYVSYPGFKEQVYLTDFRPDPDVLSELLGDDSGSRRSVVVVARPPADFAVYHRFENPLFARWLRRTASDPSVAVIVLPRNDQQRDELATLDLPSLIIPDRAIEGPSLIHAADLVVSAGGTMNREAAVLGIPAYSLFAGKSAAVDRALERMGRMTLVTDNEGLALIRLEKKQTPVPLNNRDLKGRILDSILEGTMNGSD